MTVERDGSPVSFSIQKDAGTLLGITYGMAYRPVPVTKIVWATNTVYGNFSDPRLKPWDCSSKC